MGVLDLKKINKQIAFLFILFLAVSLLSTFDYIYTGRVHTKWGDFVGEYALHALVVYWLIVLFFGYYSIKRNQEDLMPFENNLICSKCEKVIITTNEDELCLNCNIPMSKLQGFYDKK